MAEPELAHFSIDIGELSERSDNQKNAYFKKLQEAIEAIFHNYEMRGGRPIDGVKFVLNFKHKFFDNDPFVYFDVIYDDVTDFIEVTINEGVGVLDPNFNIELVCQVAALLTEDLRKNREFSNLTIVCNRWFRGGGIRKTRKCKKGSRRNPKTGKCRKPCGAGKRRNRKTRRCINKRIR
jgi:hypothetical protein